MSFRTSEARVGHGNSMSAEDAEERQLCVNAVAVVVAVAVDVTTQVKAPVIPQSGSIIVALDALR
jgi:hypothetical protein